MEGDIMTLSFTIQGDSDGYVTFECPFCGSEFKLQASEYQNEDIPFQDLFCPYCGLTSEKSSFLSHEVLEQVEAIAYNYMTKEINKSFDKMAKSINQSNGIIKMEFKPLKTVTMRELAEKDIAELEFECGYCEHHVKALYCAGISKIFCPYCGVYI